MRQFKVSYAYLGRTPEAGIAKVYATSSKEAARILSLLRPNAVIGKPWIGQPPRRKQMETVSEMIHEALVKVKEAREQMEPHTFTFLLATDTMKELADLEHRIFNQEMNAS